MGASESKLVSESLFEIIQFWGKFWPEDSYQEREACLNIKFLGGICLGHQGPRRRDIPDKNSMQVAFFL